jgi:hypothetical protein
MTDIEFGYTLSQARDKGNNLAFHLIQSFAPGEVDYDKAHEIGRQLADANGLRVEIFSCTLRKNTPRPLIRWIGGTDIKQGLSLVMRCAIFYN